MLSRLADIADDASANSGRTQYARYIYLGAGTITKVEHPAVGTGDNHGLTLDYDTASDHTYAGLDRFGRVIDQNWTVTTGGTPWAVDRCLDMGRNGLRSLSNHPGNKKRLLTPFLPEMARSAHKFSRGTSYTGRSRVHTMNIKSSPSGFLVVLTSPAYRNARNARYRGVDRVPEYPADIPEEAKALNEYIFGEFKDVKTNMIPDYPMARRLFGAFSISPRRYEIIACCSGPDDRLIRNLDLSWTILGYDVACIRSDYWSIIEDIPDAEWAKQYITTLNKYGLLCTQIEAEQYLDSYREHQEADYDGLFDIVLVVHLADDKEGVKR